MYAEGGEVGTGWDGGLLDYFVGDLAEGEVFGYFAAVGTDWIWFVSCALGRMLS